MVHKILLLILCFLLLHRNRIVKIGRFSANSIHATHYLKFSVKITTNQLHFHFRNKVPYLEKEVSTLRMEYEVYWNPFKPLDIEPITSYNNGCIERKNFLFSISKNHTNVPNSGRITYGENIWKYIEMMVWNLPQ